MKHVAFNEVERKEVNVPGAEKVTVRWLISDEDGARNFFMRRFALQPGGHTPRHTHAWEHEVYILEGEGTVFGGGKESRFRAGDVIFVPPEEEHGFNADAGTSVAFLCLIPNEGKAGGCSAPPK